jgi:hypothetical protein
VNEENYTLTLGRDPASAVWAALAPLGYQRHRVRGTAGWQFYAPGSESGFIEVEPSPDASSANIRIEIPNDAVWAAGLHIVADLLSL